MDGLPILLLMLGLGALCALLACVDQRRLWYVTRGWMYADPRAHEPSEAYLALGRAGLVFGALLSIGVGIWFVTVVNNEPTEPDSAFSTETGDGWDSDETGAEGDGMALDLEGADRFERLDGPATETPSPDTSEVREWDEALPATADTVAAILPDPRAMDGSMFVEQRDSPETAAGADAYACEAIAALCESLEAHGDVEYTTRDETRVVEFQVLAYDSARSAQAALDAVEAYYAGSYDYLTDSDNRLDVGDDFLAVNDYTTTFDEGSARAVFDVVREGPCLGIVWQAGNVGHGGPTGLMDSSIRGGLDQLIAQRMDQAKRGDQPDAVATGLLLAE